MILQNFGSSLTLSEDFYWTINGIDIFNLEKDPDAGIGSAFMDLEFLKNCLNGDYEMNVILLEKLADLLKVISSYGILIK